MRKFYFVFLCLCLIKFASANVLTTCPDGTYPAQFTGLQAAHDAASDGDTIYVYPGNYFNGVVLQFTKRLVLIGPGLSPMRPDGRPALLDVLQAKTAASSGSVFMGLQFTAIQFGDYGGAPLDNITLSNCRFNQTVAFLSGGSNIQILNCVLHSDMISAGGYISIGGNNGAANLLVQNCYFHGSLNLQGGSTGTIRNCVFASGNANDYAFYGVGGVYAQPWGAGMTIENNIFYKEDPIEAKGLTNDCRYLNNIAYLNTDPFPSNALSSGNRITDPLFVNFPAAGERFSFDYDYHLQAGSPGKNFGTDGTDVGIWGGALPVNKGFEPPIPRITQLTLDHPIVPAGGTVKLTLKAGKPN